MSFKSLKFTIGISRSIYNEITYGYFYKLKKHKSLTIYPCGIIRVISII